MQPPVGSSTVSVWDVQTQAKILEMKVHSGVHSLEFSPGDRFLATLGNEGHVVVWDVESGEVIGSVRPDAEDVGAGFVAWFPEPLSARARPDYLLVASNGEQIFRVSVRFSRGELAYVVEAAPVFVGHDARVWSAAFVTRDMRTAIALNTSGELAFLGENSVGEFGLRCLLPELVGPAVSACEMPDGSFYVASNRGVLTILARAAAEDFYGLRVAASHSLPGSIVQLRATAQTPQPLVVTTSGALLTFSESRLGLAPRTLLNFSAGRPRSVAMIPGNSAVALVGTALGTVEAWSLSEFGILDRLAPPHTAAAASVEALAVTADGSALWVGYSSGAVCATELHPSGERVFGASLCEVPEAHREGVTCLSCGAAAVASGGRDGIVRVWTPEGQLLAQIGEHRAPVTSVSWDLVMETLLHSTSQDGTVTCQAIERDAQPRRVKFRIVPGAFPVAMQQLALANAELVCADSVGVLRLYDFDLDEPVLTVQPARGPGADPAQALGDGVSADFHALTIQDRYFVHIGAKLPDGTALATVFEVVGADFKFLSVEQLGVRAVAAALTPDRRQLVVLGAEGEIAVFNFFPPEAPEGAPPTE